MQTFTSNVQKLICHDKIDYVNLRSWMTRYHFEDILKDKDLLDSEDFYKHVMQERGSRKYGMKTTVSVSKIRRSTLKCQNTPLKGTETKMIDSILLPVKSSYIFW